jgi:hypothetical protein
MRESGEWRVNNNKGITAWGFALLIENGPLITENCKL